jgi:enoyl-CoA hydratase/carnithine racemase
MEYEQITYEVAEHVAVLTYDRPEQRNAVSRRMNAELHDAWRRFRDDDDAFVLVITGAGEAFCAGWDLQDAADWPRPEWDEFRTHVYDSPGDCGYTRRVERAARRSPDRCAQCRVRGPGAAMEQRRR